MADPSAEHSPYRGALLTGLPVVAVGAAVVATSEDGGAYGTVSWATIGILAWLLSVCVHGARRRPTVGMARVAMLAVILGYALWTLLSAAWAPGAEQPFLQFARLIAYSGVFALAVVLVEELSPARLTDGIACGVAVVAWAALTVRCFPGTFSQGSVATALPRWESRLSYPVGYWNALAALLAMASPLLLRTAAARGPLWLRCCAIAVFPAIGADVFLTSSRAGYLALAVGFAAMVIFARRRFLPVAIATTLAIAGVGLGTVIVHGRGALVNGPLDSALAQSQGRAAWFLLLAATFLVAAVFVAVVPPVEKWVVSIPVWLRGGALLVGVLVVIVAIVAAHPLQRFDSFRALPAPVSGNPNGQAAHLASLSGNGRWQLWTSSYDQYLAHPVTGGGAGSFASWWSRRGLFPDYVSDAHSLFVQALGELGLVGLALIVAIWIGGPLLVAVAAFRTPSDDLVRPALVGALVGFAIGATLDWIWLVPAVAFVALVLLAVGLPVDGLPRVRVPQAVLPLVSLLAVGALLVTLAGQLQLDRSRAAAAAGNYRAAAAAAAAARDVQPWAATPYLQLALVAELAGDLDQGERWAAQATRKQPDDWRTWLALSRIQTKAGRVVAARRSLHEALELGRNLDLRAQILQSR
ncbi:MAG TPA: O-antigen ligase family protein [Gaiellaceae bacterium]|nr:O-antigen ligase family protein [Gaiellaceae bacterium]